MILKSMTLSLSQNVRSKSSKSKLCIQKTSLSLQKKYPNKSYLTKLPLVNRSPCLRNQNKENQVVLRQIRPLQLLLSRNIRQEKHYSMSVHQRAVKQELQLRTNPKQGIKTNKLQRQLKQNLQIPPRTNRKDQFQKGVTSSHKILHSQQLNNSDKKYILPMQIIQQKINKWEPEKIVISNKSIGVQTQKFDFDKESYLEFLKFKIGKPQKFEKLKKLFTFLQNLSIVESQTFQNNFQEFNQIFKQPFINERQKRVEELMNALPESFGNFNKQIQNIFSKKISFKDQMCQCSKNVLNYTQKITYQLEERILKVIQKYQGLNAFNKSEIKLISDDIHKKQEVFFIKKLTNLKQQEIKLFQSIQKIQFEYKNWINGFLQQQKLIKSCVLNLLKLPELSMVIFGMGQQNHHQHLKYEMRKYGIDMSSLPNFCDFFNSKANYNQKQFNETIEQWSQLKCLNCVYLRSKMKFIHQKNKQLKPIVKVLLHLVKDQQYVSKFQQFQKNDLKVHKQQ